MNTENKNYEQDAGKAEDYSTNPDKEDVRYIFDWDDFITFDRNGDQLKQDTNLEFPFTF